MYDIKPMERAFKEAKRAFSKEEVPVGVVIVDATGTIIATAHNEMVQRKDPTAHAELLAIQQACRLNKKGRLEDCDIYVTLEPCPMCAQAISFARLRRLYFGAYDLKGGGVDHGPRIFNSSSCHHIPETVGGLEEERCSQLLIKFFEKVRGASS
ncbi:MAG: nucleoside deaminase [Proteobacteria bacterium]|nr:nucleoside deaminase [Pseudomonadota bacterium]